MQDSLPSPSLAPADGSCSGPCRGSLAPAPKQHLLVTTCWHRLAAPAWLLAEHAQLPHLSCVQACARQGSTSMPLRAEADGARVLCLQKPLTAPT